MHRNREHLQEQQQQNMPNSELHHEENARKRHQYPRKTKQEKQSQKKRMSSTKLYNYQFNGNKSEHPELLWDKRVSRLLSSTRGSGSNCQISRKRKQLELTISHRNYRKLEERPRLTHSLWSAPTLGSQKRRPQHRPFTDHKKGQSTTVQNLSDRQPPQQGNIENTHR